MSRWTPEIVADIMRRRETGEPYAQIAADYGVSKNAIGGVVHREDRLARGEPRHERSEAKSIRGEAFHSVYADLKPAKYPYAPDISCPDFAHDEPHCAAVVAFAGGFPVMPSRRAA